MNFYIVDTYYGIFAFDDSGNILKFMDFEEDHEKIIEFYNAIDDDFLLDEFEIFLLELKRTDYDEFIFDNKNLEFLTSEQLDLKTSYNFKSIEIREYRDKIDYYLKKAGINKTMEEILAHDDEIEKKLEIRKSH